MKEYGPHFNEPLFCPPELNWNLKTDRSDYIDIGAYLGYFLNAFF